MNISLKDAYVKYGNKYALKDFTFDFVPGKIYCILGENGSGKTTLVKTIVDKFANSKEISYVAQELPSNIELLVKDVVSLGRYDASKFLSGLKEEDEKLIKSSISSMDLEGLENRLVDTLSGGEKQRVMIARGICQNTSWMVLDEPSSSLDVRHTESIMNRILNLKTNGNKSFIIVLHDINLASRYADEILLMKDGKLIASCEELNTEILKECYSHAFEKISLPSGKIFFVPTEE